MLYPDTLLNEVQNGQDPQQVFELLEMIGQGAYGSVNKALNKQTGDLYAIKIVPASSLAELQAIKRQVSMLRNCHHQHIVGYYGCYLKYNNLWIIMEYCAIGSIADIIHITHQPLNEEEIACILKDILKALQYLHGKLKIHRDIKATNILLNQKGEVKLADFGVSAELAHTQALQHTYIGSPCWMSPQVIAYTPYNHKTDIWSLGVTTIELTEGVVPYAHLKPFMAIWTMRDKPIQSLKNPEKWSKQLNQFISECLMIDPNKRPQANELLKHNFIIKNSNSKKTLSKLAINSLVQIQNFRLKQDNILQNNSIRIQGIRYQQQIKNRRKQNLQEEQQIIINNQNNSVIYNNNNNNINIYNNNNINKNNSIIINEQNSIIINNNQNQQQINYLKQYIQEMKKQQQNNKDIKYQLQQQINQIQQQFHLKIKLLYLQYKEKISCFLAHNNPLNLQSKIYQSQTIVQYFTQINSDLKLKQNELFTKIQLQKDQKKKKITSEKLSIELNLGTKSESEWKRATTEPNPQPKSIKKMQQFMEDPIVMNHLKNHQNSIQQHSSVSSMELLTGKKYQNIVSQASSTFTSGPSPYNYQQTHRNHYNSKGINSGKIREKQSKGKNKNSKSKNHTNKQNHQISRQTSHFPHSKEKKQSHGSTNLTKGSSNISAFSKFK